MIYQSSNQYKIYNQYQSKSVNKTYNKKINNYNHNTSLEKNKDSLFKTEARGFYIERSEDKLENLDIARKTQEMGWQSSNQLPLLIMSSSNYNNQHGEPPTVVGNKKKPQIYIQKTQQASSNFNSNKPHANIIKKWTKFVIYFYLLPHLLHMTKWSYKWSPEAKSLESFELVLGLLGYVGEVEDSYGFLELLHTEFWFSFGEVGVGQNDNDVDANFDLIYGFLLGGDDGGEVRLDLQVIIQHIVIVGFL